MLRIVSTLFLISAILFLSSCVAKRVEMPVYEGVDVKEVLSSKNNISAIETTLSVTFEEDDKKMKGDGVLNISRNGDLSMRVYSFGFLAFEITSENGIIKSVPIIDKYKGTLLTYGLRDCLFWWDIKNFEIKEEEHDYILKNFMREVWIDRKTMFPLKQILSFGDGRQLNISYENPERANDIWYPSKIRIEFLNYCVILKIKDISFSSLSFLHESKQRYIS